MTVHNETSNPVMKRHFLEILHNLTKEGYAITTLSHKHMHARFSSQKGSLFVYVPSTEESLCFKGEKTDSPETCDTDLNMVIPLCDYDPISLIAYLIKVKPPTGTTNLTEFVSFMSNNNLIETLDLCCVTLASKCEALIDITSRGIGYEFKMLNSDVQATKNSLPNLVTKFRDKKLYFVSPEELLDWVMAQEKRSI